jgi:hypothetical protein
MARLSSCEVRELVDKACVNDAVYSRCSPAQAVQILQISAMHLGPCSNESFSTRIGTSKPDHLVPCPNKLLNNRRADKSCRARDEYTHVLPPFTAVRSFEASWG